MECELSMSDERVLYGLRVHDEGHVRVVTLDRPERRNPIDLEIRPVLTAVFDEADADPDVRAVVLTGRDGAFCSGGDLSIMHKMAPHDSVPRLQAAQRIARAIAGSGTPVVAAVDGGAVAAGLGLALCCDRVVASTTAVFDTGFVRVGLGTDLAASWALARRVGVARAQQMMIFPERLRGPEAFNRGLVDVVVPPEDVLGRALDDARRLATLPPRALSLLKRHFASMGNDLDQAIEDEIAIQAELMTTDDYAEGIAAALEKRPANFTGR
ncbi:enoyl CoA hydratase [Gordonia polyisoprenivorans VH2]|uniref:Enoyl CoA hydratase n=2 Tax=Gordonia polyisoprenivorans TaxID=84595 RepID=H6N3S7_GORPV|nr:enoyl CoA hydratase [Gordonia polyisoprenivorans VH2]